MSPNTNPLWRIVSRGYSGENLELGKKTLEVFLPEMSGFTEGEITAHRTVLKTDGVDYRGNPYTVEIVTANTIEAIWRSSGGNRVTPPDIRRGERVDIWQYENIDKYYWVANDDDGHLRRLETATWAFSNTQDENTKEIDETNSYNVQVSTHQKQINVNTTMSDGEPFTHHIQIDTKNGNMHYRDSAGNYIQVEAGSNTITVENAAASSVVLAGPDVSITAPNELNLKCKTLNIDADVIQERSSTKTVKSSTITENASSKTVNADVSTKGALKNNGKNVGSSHVHGGVKSGGSNTGGPS